MHSDLAEILSQQILDCRCAGQIEKDDLIEPAPKRRVEQPLMVRRGDCNRVTPESVEDLEKRVDDSLDLAVFFKRGPILPDGIDHVRVVQRLYTNSPVDTAKKIGFWNKNFELSRDVNLVEDFPLQMTVHSSLMSGDIKELIYGRNEPSLIYFHQKLAKRLGTQHG